MKLFLAKLLLFSSPIIAALALIGFNLAELRADPLNNSIMERIEVFREDKVDVSVIIAGDSKAAFQVMSPLFDTMMRVHSANIGLGGCDLITAYNALEKAGLLSGNRTVIISQSLGQINDNSQTPSNPSPAFLMNLSMSQSLLFLARHPDNAMAHLQKLAMALVRRAMNAKAWDSISPFGPKAGTGIMTDQVRTLAGKLPFGDPGKLTPRHIRNPYYRNLETHGIKREAFKQTLEKLGKSQGRFILFHGPMSPKWRSATRGSFVEEAEMEFSRFIREESARFTNITFLDLYAEFRDSIPEAMFHDPAHLNAEGARYFTGALSRYLVESGLIGHKANSLSNGIEMD